MKCPFCDTELKQYGNDCVCPNGECRETQNLLPINIWRALISGQNAKAAVDYTLIVLDSTLLAGREIPATSIYRFMKDIEKRANAPIDTNPTIG